MTRDDRRRARDSWSSRTDGWPTRWKRRPAASSATCRRSTSISLDWDDDVADARRRIEEGIAQVAVEGRVLILTDMSGGTPSNVALSLLEPGRVDVVTGVNLPMLIKFANLHSVDGFDETVRRIAQQGRDAIQVASRGARKARRAGEHDGTMNTLEVTIVNRLGPARAGGGESSCTWPAGSPRG